MLRFTRSFRYRLFDIESESINFDVDLQKMGISRGGKTPSSRTWRPRSHWLGGLAEGPAGRNWGAVGGLVSPVGRDRCANFHLCDAASLRQGKRAESGACDRNANNFPTSILPPPVRKPPASGQKVYKLTKESARLFEKVVQTPAKT